MSTNIIKQRIEAKRKSYAEKVAKAQSIGKPKNKPISKRKK